MVSRLCLWLMVIVSSSLSTSEVHEVPDGSENNDFEERMRAAFPEMKNIEDFRNQTMSRVKEIINLLNSYPEDDWNRIVPGVDVKKLNESMHHFLESLPDIIGLVHPV